MRKSTIAAWAVVSLIWIAWAAATTTFAYSWMRAVHRPMTWMSVAPTYFAAYALWGVLFTPIVVLLAKSFPFEKRHWIRSVIVHLVSCPLVALLHASLSTLFDHWIRGWGAPMSPETKFHTLQRYFLMNGSDNIFIYWTIVLLVQGWIYYQRYSDRELTASLLETQLARSELKALKGQLQPHFLFNTLNSVAELMHQDLASAERVIMVLSDLLRQTLENVGVQEVSLRQEVDFVKAYLEIERVRFQDRLTVEFKIVPETLDAKVPNLLLQPIVENAIRHGVAKNARPGHIEIASFYFRDRVAITVKDNGSGLKNGGDGKHFGIGLSSTRARLQYLYGDKHYFKMSEPPEGGVEVRVVIPLDSEREPVTDPLTISTEDRPIPQGVSS